MGSLRRVVSVIYRMVRYVSASYVAVIEHEATTGSQPRKSNRKCCHAAFTKRRERKLRSRQWRRQLERNDRSECLVEGRLVSALGAVGEARRVIKQFQI